MVTPDKNKAFAVEKELDKAGTFEQVGIFEGFDDTPQIGGFRLTDLANFCDTRNKVRTLKIYRK